MTGAKLMKTKINNRADQQLESAKGKEGGEGRGGRGGVGGVGVGSYELKVY